MTDTVQTNDDLKIAQLNADLVGLLAKSALPIRDPFYRMANYETLLRSKDLTRMLQLVNSGADVNTQGPDGATLLMRAAEFGKKDFIEQVLAHNPQIDQRDKNGQTALHHAATFNRTKAVEMLLEAGADPVAVDHDAMSPLACAYAEFKNHDSTIEVLLQARHNAIVHGHLYPALIDDVYAQDRSITFNVRAALKDRVERLRKFKTDQRSLEIRRSFLVQKYNRPEEQ